MCSNFNKHVVPPYSKQVSIYSQISFSFPFMALMSLIAPLTPLWSNGSITQFPADFLLLMQLNKNTKSLLLAFLPSAPQISSGVSYCNLTFNLPEVMLINYSGIQIAQSHQPLQYHHILANYSFRLQPLYTFAWEQVLLNTIEVTSLSIGFDKFDKFDKSLGMLL